MKRRLPKRKERFSHADDWLMTYADMITLLLCFFAVFLAVSMPKKEMPQKTETPPVVQSAPQPPVAPVRPFTLAENGLPLRDLSQSEEPDDVMPLVATQTVANDPPPASVAAVAPPPPPAAVPPSAPVENASATLPEIVDHLKTQGNANIEQKGDRITTMQISSAAFFGSGSAELSDSGKTILQSMIANLKSEQFRDYEITVEGHTDDQPIKTAQFPSNWELSTARAAAVARFFLEQGIAASRLRAAGYADTFPIAANRDAGGNPIPENQARNRRVVIKLEKIEKRE